LKTSSLEHERIMLRLKVEKAEWYNNLEPFQPLATKAMEANAIVPHVVAELFPQATSLNVVRLCDLPIQVGQGLRTGCNIFFYVSIVGREEGDHVLVRTDPSLGSREVWVPKDALLPVLRRQQELRSGAVIPDELLGRVLDLRQWVLPEDYSFVLEKSHLYSPVHRAMPQLMPDSLAAFVREAAHAKVGNKPIPQLSAVRTNIRVPKTNETAVLPRFWYMLPDFTRRHLPDVFISRINHRSPQAYENTAIPILIDANFSTLWTTDADWTAPALRVLLNSAWARVCMEAIGTPLGGGALKLEATQLRNLPLPSLDKYALEKLHRLGKNLNEDSNSMEEVDSIVLSNVLGQTKKFHIDYQHLMKTLYDLINFLGQNRQRKNHD
jgi:hypothetical protein